MNYKYQFFISSTYKDLIKERQIAINAIMKMGHIPAGMELFTATGEEQFESIKPIIDESDYYLIILSGKYGTVVKDEKISYTEKEFNYALSVNKRIIAFVYDEPKNLPVNKRETKTNNMIYFNNFREKILNNRMVYIWKNHIDLLQGILTSINNVVNNYPSETRWIHTNKSNETSNTKNVKEKIDSKIETINVLSSKQYKLLCYGISEELVKFTKNDKGNSLVLTLHISTLDISYKEYRYISLKIDSLPCYDWRRYVLHNSAIKFSIISTNNIKNMYFKITTDNIDISENELELEKGVLKEYSIFLGKYISSIDHWRIMDEISFVLYPGSSECYEAEISIFNLRIEP